jgi:hypothetical protein
MALYEEFTFKSNGVELTSMNDFIGADIGTQFEKNTGELYIKSADGVFDKVLRKYFSQIESESRYFNVTGDTISGALMPNANNTLMIGSDTVRFNTIYATNFNGTATTAKYADLAEKYETDREYSVGTVLEVQGEKEVTLYKGGALAGVISENPGLMINAEGNGQYITLKGKVPVICEGDIYKGQYCLAIPGGKVQGKFKEEITALDVLNIVGVALEDSKNNMVQVKI